ncbi:MAG: hypothetical protein J7L15_02210 [Clostridiales bacterium]|nr:hypothetical protein [Clostridiales bacterium]
MKITLRGTIKKSIVKRINELFMDDCIDIVNLSELSKSDYLVIDEESYGALKSKEQGRDFQIITEDEFNTIMKTNFPEYCL